MFTGRHLILMLKIKNIYIYVHTFTPPTTHKRWEKTTKTITIIKNKNFINRKSKPGFFFAWGVKVQQHTRTRVAEPNLSFYFSELQRQHLFLMYLFLHPSPQFISPALYFLPAFKKNNIGYDLGWQTFQLYLSLLHMRDYGVTV